MDWRLNDMAMTTPREHKHTHNWCPCWTWICYSYIRLLVITCPCFQSTTATRARIADFLVVVWWSWWWWWWEIIRHTRPNLSAKSTVAGGGACEFMKLHSSGQARQWDGRWSSILSTCQKWKLQLIYPDDDEGQSEDSGVLFKKPLEQESCCKKVDRESIVSYKLESKYLEVHFPSQPWFERKVMIFAWKVELEVNAISKWILSLSLQFLFFLFLLHFPRAACILERRFVTANLLFSGWFVC